MIKEGYDLKMLEGMEPVNDAVDVDELKKGYLWSGVREYLLEDENMLMIEADESISTFNKYHDGIVV